MDTTGIEPFDFSGLPADKIAVVWPDVKPLVQRGLMHSVGEYSVEDIYMMIAVGRMQLWVVSEDIELRGIIITELLPYPREYICQVVIVAGDEIDRWDHHLNAVEEWALELGATSMRAYGRLGWKPRAKEHEYEMTYCVYSKSLRAGHENTH